MGFLDGLDAAFDNMMKGENADDSAASAGKVDSGDDPSLHGVAELKAALAREHQVAVTGLIALVHQLPRPYLCAALCGAARFVAHVSDDPAHKDALQQVEQIVLTKKGLPRKLLRGPEIAELQALAEPLTAPDQKVIDALSTYLQLLTSLPVMEPSDVCQLFQAGLWRGELICNARIEESAQLANLPQHKIATLKAAVNERT